MIHPALQRAIEDMRAGRIDVALKSLQRIVKRQPRDHNAAQILALLLVQSGKAKAALPYLAAAVNAEPRAVQFRNNYANTLLQLKRYAEAAKQWERAVQLDPQYALGWLGLASTKVFLSDSAGAQQAAERGLEIRPGWPEMTVNLVLAQAASGQIEEAIALSEKVLAANPHQPALRSNYLLMLNYRSDAAALIEAHREFGRLHAQTLRPPPADANPDRALRIGVLSADLRTHSVAFFAEPILRHAPEWVTLIACSLGATPDDEMTQRLRGMSDQWIEVGAMDDTTLNKTIRTEQIDILLDLHGHTAGSRLLALADKPAPVIITALGYPNTTGLTSIDWRLVDSITDPPGTEAFATERLLRLDPCFLCYAPPADAPEPALPPPSAPITFGSFNAVSKISDLTLDLWASVMAGVPGSRLLLKTRDLSDPSAQEHLAARLASVGISRDCVELLPQTATIREHLAAYARVHVALDTMPYNGTTTTCEALWMGVPVVCLQGDRHAARVGASLLTAIGRTNFLTGSNDDYVSTAIRLANDRAALEELRFGLRQSMRQSPLLDAATYAERFYAAMRSCWVDWCQSTGKHTEAEV